MPPLLVGAFFISGLEKNVEVRTVTGCPGRLWPADAGP